MRFGKYVCTISLQRECFLPKYKGSTFRGAFGWALKKAVCIFKGRACTDCPVSSQCIYARTFEPFSEKSKLEDSVALSPPYCFEPPQEIATHWPSGSILKFSLLLFGEANDYLPYYVFALEKMGRSGIGKTVDSKRCPFKLISVKDNDRELYDPEHMKLTEKPRSLELQINDSVNRNIEKVTVNLLSPLRIKSNQSLQKQLPFHVLIRGILRRVSSLFTLYGQGEPDLDYKGLIQRAGDVKDDPSGLTWIDYLRYSNRQKKNMFLGGMIGNVSYEGDLAEFIPLIKLGSLLHIGKQTSFGLGQFEFQPQ